MESTPSGRWRGLGERSELSRSRPSGTRLGASQPRRARCPSGDTPSSTPRSALGRFIAEHCERSSAAKPSRFERLERLLAHAGLLERLRHPVPPPVREEAGRADHQRLDRVGVVARPHKADQPSPIVHHRHAALDPSSRRKRSTESTRRSQVPGASGGESPKPARSGAMARQPAAARARHHALPHVRRLGNSHAAAAPRAIRRTALAIEEFGGEHLTLEHDGSCSGGQTAARRHGAAQRPARSRARRTGPPPCARRTAR